MITSNTAKLFATPNERWSQLHDLINKLLFEISYVFNINITVRYQGNPGLTARSDGWELVLLNSQGHAVGYCETRNFKYVQDVLLYLKYMSRIDRPLCFLTHYDAWQICWLDENDDVTGSQVYKYSDPDLVVVLAGVLYTLAGQNQSCDIRRVPLIHENHDQCEWVAAPDVDLLRNDGDYNDRSYRLISHLGTGRDGAAYLASSMSGSICVVKFVFGGNGHASMEAENWKKTYGIEVRLIQALGMYVIVLPFVYILEDDYKKNEYLQKAASFFIEKVKLLALNDVQHPDPVSRHVGFLSVDRPVLIDWSPWG